MYGRRQGTISAHFSEITLGIGGGRYVRISSFCVINLRISRFFVILINLNGMFRKYRSLENFRLNLFRCNKISSKKFSWITYTHENILTTKI